MTAAYLRTVLFDLDGTLIDSADLILDSFRHTMRVHLGRELPDAAWLRTMGQPLEAQFLDFARSPEEAEAMLATYLEHNAAMHDRLLRSFPGMREYVEGLVGRGFRLGIVTSKRREGTLRGLELCGFEVEWFTAVVTASDVERFKPDPEPVRRALEAAAEGEAGRSLFVGDSVHDLRAGRAAGTRTGAALWGPYSREELAPAAPDHWLEGLQALDAVLERGDE
ncbi:MAG: HAD-IA family hydrolase [Candidatus Palauibacterales bacterium]|nr:HAD-IA family hydrolase [Candidatus Palauibacterales bacterium]MDP2583353.1 HAD-IA family hydrolase [Candidatus Palauibacterales bacterium]